MKHGSQSVVIEGRTQSEQDANNDEGIADDYVDDNYEDDYVDDALNEDE